VSHCAVATGEKAEHCSPACILYEAPTSQRKYVAVVSCKRTVCHDRVCTLAHAASNIPTHTAPARVLSACHDCQHDHVHNTPSPEVRIL
jgi:hypothetical protein